MPQVPKVSYGKRFIYMINIPKILHIFSVWLPFVASNETRVPCV